MTRAFCFLDLETTGLNLQTAQILEVACILTDFHGLNEFGNVHSYVHYEDVTFDPFIVNMHTENGLWDAMNNWMLNGEKGNARPLPQISYVDTLLADWIGNLKAVYNLDHIEMAGSTIGQFDMQLCNRDFPHFMKHLHHRVFDVRSLKTLAEMTHNDVPEIIVEPKHRAMSDCQSELKYARQFLRPMWETSSYAEHVEKIL